MNLTNDYKPDVLYNARRIYGNKNQICVSIEELCELACALSKYPRYDTDIEAKNKIRQKVLDEFADVTIVLEHVRDIFDLADYEVHTTQQGKIDRLERWLKNDSSGSMERTTIDRAVESIGVTLKDAGYSHESEANLYSQGCCDEF